jgi:hypothetical protein
MTTTHAALVPAVVAPDFDSFAVRQAIAGFLAGYGDAIGEPVLGRGRARSAQPRPAQTGDLLREQLTTFLGGCEVLTGINGFAQGPEDMPDAVGECTRFQKAVHLARAGR